MSTNPLTSLVDEVRRAHFPNPPAPLEEIERFERQVGWQLDRELRAFYLACNGARLFRPANGPYHILPLDRIVRARVAILGEDEDRFGPASLYVLCDMLDGNYVAIDSSPKEGDLFPLVDCFHETFPDPVDLKVIAPSFAPFLERALRSEGFSYWL